MDLHMNQGPWSFVAGPWSEDAAGVITSPQQADLHLAFSTGKAYVDLDAEFEFRRDAHHAGLGLIVRAQDAQRYYVVEFPFCGQQIREGHFWAGITPVDDTGWARVLMLERVPGVPAEAGLWHHVRVTVHGDEMRLWVNGRPLPPVRDDAYPAPGRVGLLSWLACSLRSLRVRGVEAPLSPGTRACNQSAPGSTPTPPPTTVRAPPGSPALPAAIC